MSTFVYYNDLWLIGPTDVRRQAERWVRRSGATAPEHRFTAMFHPDQGHEVASVLTFDTPNRSFHHDAQALAKAFPGLQVLTASCDEDGDSGGWAVYQADETHQDRRFPDPSNDPDEVMHAQRRAWWPTALPLAQAVPFPDGTVLEQACWRDDGAAVARLLQDPAHRPGHPERWWAGLLDAGRRQAVWVDTSPGSGHHLDGRGPGWTRSAVDAWADAFPNDLRDVERWLDGLDHPDVPTRAALARWVGPDRIYSLPPLDEVGEPLAGVTPPNPPDPTRLLDLPGALSQATPAEARTHHRLLTAMPAHEREGLLNAWLARASLTNLFDPTDEQLYVDTVEAWSILNLVPLAWFEPRTIEWVRQTTGPERGALTSWLERHALRAELGSTVLGNGGPPSPVPRPRPRL